MNSNIKEMTRFFVPLAATSVLMMSSHSIVSSGLARTTEANAALAAYAVAQSLAVMFEGPCYTMQRMCVALFKDKTSYSSVQKMVLGTWALITTLMLLVAFTPIGVFVFTRLLRVPEYLYPETIGAFRVFMLLPLANALRSFYQGIIVVHRKTSQLTINMVIRLTVMLLLASFLPRFSWLPGASVGALVLGLGILTEGFLAYVTGRHLVAKLPDEHAYGKSVSVWEALRFFLPLALASLAWTFTRPILNAALARTLNPELALASYQIAWSFSYIFAAVAFNIHQLAIIFGQEKNQRIMALKFSMVVGLIGALALTLAVSTPAGYLILTRIIGASAELAREALGIIAILCFMPVVMSVTEFCNGLLMSSGQTKYLTAGKVLNITTIVVASSAMTALYPQAGGQLAALALMIGALTETSFLMVVTVPAYHAASLSPVAAENH